VVILGSLARSKHFQGMLKVVMVMKRWMRADGGQCKRLMVKQILRDRHSLSL
jgi:hypothetical protein